MGTYNSADIAAFKDVWVFCEQRQGVMMPTSYELISEGRKLADELGVNLCGLLVGDNVEHLAKDLGGHGADKVYLCESPRWWPTLSRPTSLRSCSSAPPTSAAIWLPAVPPVCTPACAPTAPT